MGEDGHGSLWDFQGVACFIVRRQFPALLRCPDSGVLCLIMNCGRILDFGRGGGMDLYANCFRLFTPWMEGGAPKITPSSIQE